MDLIVAHCMEIFFPFDRDMEHSRILAENGSVRSRHVLPHSGCTMRAEHSAVRVAATGDRRAGTRWLYSYEVSGGDRETETYPMSSLPSLSLLPLYHASGFSWDEALVLVVAIAAVPLLSVIIDRRSKRQADEAAKPEEPPVDP
jgi:hypothetical protein